MRYALCAMRYEIRGDMRNEIGGMRYEIEFSSQRERTCFTTLILMVNKWLKM